MARSPKTGGKASAAKTRKARSSKDRNPKTQAQKTPAAKLDNAVPDPPQTIAELRRELDTARAGLAARDSAYSERIAYQAATNDVLKVMSASPGNPQPVFDLIATRARDLCDAYGVTVYEFDGELVHYRVATGVSDDPEVRKAFAAKYPMPPTRDMFPHRAMLDRKLIRIDDLKSEPGLNPIYQTFAVGSAVAVPMMRGDVAIGALGMGSRERGGFTDSQIELLKTFADQAVIALENTRLFNETQEALERQTATADILKVVASSPSNVQPVFETIAESAKRLLGSYHAIVTRVIDDKVHLAAFTAGGEEGDKNLQSRFPMPLSGPGPNSRAARTGEIERVTDTETYLDSSKDFKEAARARGFRSVLVVPMLRNGVAIGTIATSRRQPGSFADKEIDLLRTFADQAVIAIENARLFNETREALERQTATSEVLKAISSSPGELKPVFEAMLAYAVRICEAKFGTLFLCEGDDFRVAAEHNTPPALLELHQREPVIRVGPSTSLYRSKKAKQPIQIADLTAEPAYFERDQNRLALVELGGYRGVLSVPMVKEGEAIGAINMYRQDAGTFSDNQVELVKNFAAQAVIAIENARLLNELRQRTDDLSEALEQQTATSEVLRVISSSPGELEPVFKAMLENATRLCEANFGNLFVCEGNGFRSVAVHSPPSAYTEWYEHHPFFDVKDHPQAPLARLAKNREIIHIVDLRLDPGYAARIPVIVAFVDDAGANTLLVVPMLKEDKLIGAIVIFRTEKRPFSEKQIELVRNFAAQAAIAIENSRLLSELRESYRLVQEQASKLETQSQELVKLNQQLEERVANQVGEIERMSRLRRFLPPQVADLIVASGGEKQLESHRREITALFCDLRGFTGFSEASAPEDVMALLRDYHAAIGEIIIKYSGTLERYAGDGVMVVFNDPVPVDNPALRAVLMALETREAMGALMEKWRQLGHDVGFGIGIAHGFATLGTIGFEGRFDYAAIGTVSNVASRLCDEAKPGQILISPRVFTAVKDAVTVEPVGEFTLKGIGRPLAAYNVLGAKPAN